jgi:hypothetical protein
MVAATGEDAGAQEETAAEGVIEGVEAEVELVEGEAEDNETVARRHPGRETLPAE